MPTLDVLNLLDRLTPYMEGWDEQRRLHDAVVDGSRDNVLMLVEHEPVYTAGKRTQPEDRPTDGSPVIDVDRGGRITWHGPGQLVGYPILDLRPDRCDVHAYVRDLEEVMIRTCLDFGVPAGRLQGLTGTWVAGNKIGAIGVRISRWITSHGFAFNVNTDLSHFQLIVPCGIADAGVTSLARVLRVAPAHEAVEAAFIAAFTRMFHVEHLVTADTVEVPEVQSVLHAIAGVHGREVAVMVDGLTVRAVACERE